MNTIPTNFSQKMTALGFRTYEEYLQSEHWQKFRKKFFRSKGRKKSCLCCRVPNFEIELHHTNYERLGAERLNDVIPLCREHHEQLHELLNQEYQGDVRWSARILHRIAQDRKRGSSRGKRLRRYRKGH